MSIGNPKSESKTKDVDISIEETSQLLESGDTTPTSGHQSSSFLQDNAVTTDMDPKLTRAVTSLLESECPSLLHDYRFDNPIIQARHPKEFDELKYEGSPIKPGVLNILSLIDVCL
ncbi:hypothetical protein BDD12DRAFT_806267 [Trichophaea hybrida]|nr:hypothetical protein BDD12DRAFT_806267 [Trichophaea hybrida]